MQATGNLVGALFELAAGVQHGHHDVDGGNTGGMHGNRNTAAVVDDLHAAILENAHIDFGGESGHRLVDRVIDDFPDQVVQAALAG